MTALTAYMDAVVDALLDGEVGVADHYADEVHPEIGIELDPVTAVRQPAMLWTPDSGWRIAMLCRGEVRRPTLRYLALGAAPRPAPVVRLVRLWLDEPGALTDAQPVYTAQRAQLRRRLAAALR